MSPGPSSSHLRGMLKFIHTCHIYPSQMKYLECALASPDAVISQQGVNFGFCRIQFCLPFMVWGIYESDTLTFICELQNLRMTWKSRPVSSSNARGNENSLWLQPPLSKKQKGSFRYSSPCIELKINRVGIPILVVQQLVANAEVMSSHVNQCS